MLSRFGKFVSMLAVTLLLCGLTGGCSSTGYHYNDLPDIHYYNVTLSLEVPEKALESLGNVTNANIYIYDKNGIRIAGQTNMTSLTQDDEKCFSIMCSSTGASATLDYLDNEGKFLGCSTVKLEDMGDDPYEYIDVDKVYNASTLSSTYKLSLKEIDVTKTVGGNIVLEAILKTPYGEQIVTDNSKSIDWTSSNTAVLSPVSSGAFQAIGAGSATIDCTYNDVLHVSTIYTISNT